MFKTQKNSRSLSFDQPSLDNKENEVLAALNKTEMELSKINKYLYEDFKPSSSQTLPLFPENGLKELHSNSHSHLVHNEKKDHAFCSPRFNPSQEINSKNLFKIIKPDNNNNQEEKSQANRRNKRNTG